MNAHILRLIYKGILNSKGPLTAGANFSLSRLMRNTPNFLKGAYADKLSRMAAFTKGAGRGLTNTAAHWASPTKSKMFRDLGISPGTKDIVDDALYKSYQINRTFAGKKLPPKWKHELNTLERQIYGQLAQEKTAALAYGQRPSGLLSKFMSRHMNQYDLSALPEVSAARQIKGGKHTLPNIWNKDPVMADQILKGHGSSLDDLAKGKISGKILNYKSTKLNTSLRDTQYSNQAAGMFRAFQDGAKTTDDFIRIGKQYGVGVDRKGTKLEQAWNKVKGVIKTPKKK